MLVHYRLNPYHLGFSRFKKKSYAAMFSFQTLLDDPLYIGVPQKRVTGKAYDDLIDEFIRAATER